MKVEDVKSLEGFDSIDQRTVFPRGTVDRIRKNVVKIVCSLIESSDAPELSHQGYARRAFLYAMKIEETFDLAQVEDERTIEDVPI